VSRVGAVGIDVERVQRTQFRGFTEVALHPDERATVLSGADAATSWVRKEAVLKALGVGLRVEPAALMTPPIGVARVVLAGRPPAVVDDLTVGQGYAAALAVLVEDGPASGTAVELTVRRH
jgi:4'-phosphopantetheinyl transferase